MPHSSSGNKQGSWARTLFAGNPSGYNSQISEPEANDNPVPESPGTTYNQQATNAVLSLLNIHVCCAVILACFYLFINGKVKDILEIEINGFLFLLAEISLGHSSTINTLECHKCCAKHVSSGYSTTTTTTISSKSIGYTFEHFFSYSFFLE